MGTARGGLNQANLRKPSLFNVVNHGNFELPLHELVVFSFEESQDNRLIWVDTNHGLYLIDRATGKIRDQWHEAAQEGLTGETVMSLFQLKNGQLLLSTRPGGTQILDPETRKVRRVPNPEMGAQEEISFFRTIREHSPDSLLLSGNLGVWLFTPSDENWQLLVGGYCWDALGGAEEGEVLVAENGLHQLDICVDSTILYRWHPTQHDHKRPMTYLFRDSVNLWIGTYGMGLIRVNLKDWSFRRWSRKDGLPSDYVFTILEDEQSRLWVSTTEGLARLDRESGDILTFSMEDGLMDNEFGTSSAFVAEDGEMFFGGNNGFVSFYPDQIEIRQSRFAPPVLITSLSLSGKPMVLDSAVWVKRHITFKGYPQQHLEIGYAGLDFSRPGNLSYQFRLLGWDESWSVPDLRGNAQFTNLQPGTYEFQVRCTNGDGKWTSSIRSLFITITPLWYQTWWVRVMIPLTFLLLIFGGLIWRFRLSQRRERMALSFRMAAVKQEALSAQMDHHFTFNALNSIQRFITENDKDSSLYYISRFGKLIRRFLDQARKNEHPIEDEITTLDLYLSLESLRCQQAFTYQFEVDPEIDPFNTDIPTSLLQPLVENAIWHGLVPRNDRKGRLLIRFLLSDAHLILRVEDNGVGKSGKPAMGTAHQSKGMTIIRERLHALEILTGQPLPIEFEELTPGSDFPGTKVSILLPPPDFR